MATTQSAQPRLRPSHTREAPGPPGSPARDARAEIDELRSEIEARVTPDPTTPALETLSSALESVTRLQVVTANLDACNPTKSPHVGAALIALADAHLRGHADAIERGMTYTSDNQMRLLQTR